MRARREVLAATTAALLIAAGTLTTASTFLKVDAPGLARQSESVIHARVADVRSAWNADRTMIFTHATLDVVRTLQGRADARIMVRIPGGTVDGFTAEMIGAPVVRTGEEIVAFIARWDDGEPMIAGYAQGVSRVARDRAGNLVLRGGLGDGLLMIDFARGLGQSGR